MNRRTLPELNSVTRPNVHWSVFRNHISISRKEGLDKETCADLSERGKVGVLWTLVSGRIRRRWIGGQSVQLSQLYILSGMWFVSEDPWSLSVYSINMWSARIWDQSMERSWSPSSKNNQIRLRYCLLVTSIIYRWYTDQLEIRWNAKQKKLSC